MSRSWAHGRGGFFVCAFSLFSSRPARIDGPCTCLCLLHLRTITVADSIAHAENQQFVKVLVASKKRFTTLRELTIEGAQAELERQAIERKDRGDGSASRGNSMDSMRRPAPVRTPSLAEVPEDSQFTIGDDEDEDEVDTTVTSATSPTRLSEKARGKQPAALRVSTSRNASTTSLNTLTTPATTTSATFLPSEQWLENWYTQLPLEPILKVIEETEQQHGFTRNSTTRRPEEAADHADLPSTTSENQSGYRREARQSSQLTRQSVESGRSSSTQETQGADGQGHLGSKGEDYANKLSCVLVKHLADSLGMTDDIKPAAGGPVNFVWTAVAIGW